MKKMLIIITSFLLLLAPLIGAAKEDRKGDDTPALAETEFSTACPAGWMDTLIAEIKCNPTLTMELRQFDQSTCSRCVVADTDSECSEPWVPVDAEIECAPGSVLITNQHETCKRCTPERQNFECRTDSDCFRTGCSGQVCSSEPVITTCEWFPYYACYEDQYCVCENHRCTWDDDPILEQCIEDAGKTSPAPLIKY